MISVGERRKRERERERERLDETREEHVGKERRD